jgi:thiol-disulfide isomerase/thioredoxin
MKALIISMIFLLISSGSWAQKVSLLTADELNQRLSQGKDTVYIVNLWATWCQPCVKELPDFEKLQKKFAAEPLKVLLVSLDFRSKLESEVKPFVTRMKLTNEVFLMNEKDQQSFIEKIDDDWTGTIPATLIVNAAKKHRQLITNELTYNELLYIYHINKQ